MRSPRPSAAWLLIAVGSVGCSGDVVTTGRADSGVKPPDAGNANAIAYTAGMRFSYSARLTYRSNTGEESNSTWDLAMTVGSVDDQGPMGDSTMIITATGQQGMTQNWNPTAGFDSWIDRLGPADDADQISTSPLAVHLTRAPLIPDPAPRKTIPNDGVYFLDLRKEESIRTDFFDTAMLHNLMGRFVDPTQNPTGRWTLGLTGPDASIQYYPAASKKRELSLEYHPTGGWLVHAEETIGDSTMANTPTGSFFLDLKAGP